MLKIYEALRSFVFKNN